jgi:putative FmdB family regulatory protein
VPTYEYRCRACGHELEAVQSFSDDALTECPSCGGQLRKVFGSIGVTFKGSGFYKTDSRSGSSTSSSSGSGSGSDSSGTSGSDSKTSGDSGTSGSSGSSGSSDSGTSSSTPSSSPA